MSTFKRFSYFTILLITIFSATSCLEKTGNYETFTGLTGSISTSALGTNYLRLDKCWGGGFYYSSDLQSYADGDRLLVSFKIDYDNQTSSSHYIISDLIASKFPLKPVYKITEQAADTFGTDAIHSLQAQFISVQGSDAYLTINSYYEGSNSSLSPNLVLNELASNVVNSDTLKLEYRLNKKGDVGTTLFAKLISFDITDYLREVTTPKVIEVKYNTSSGEYLNYTTYTSSN